MARKILRSRTVVFVALLAVSLIAARAGHHGGGLHGLWDGPL